MEKMIFFVSDCCNCEMSFGQVDYGICPDCGEHCEVLTEEVVEDSGEF